MSDVSRIMRDRQRTVRRLLDQRKIALKVVSFDSGIKYDTLVSYFPGGEREPSELPIGAFNQLHGAIPDDLLNLLVPDGWAVVRVPEGVDYDEIAADCRSLIDEKDRAHHPQSEAGREIGPGEQQNLGSKVVQLRGRIA